MTFCIFFKGFGYILFARHGLFENFVDAAVFLYRSLFRQDRILTRVESFGNFEFLVGGISQVFVLIYLLEEIGADGQSRRGSLSVCHAVEMDVAVFAAYPTTGRKRRRETYEPTVGVPVGGSRFSSHVGIHVVTEAHAAARTSVHDALQHDNHLISAFLADDFRHAGLELPYYIPFVVFYPRHEKGSRTNAAVGKGRV